MSMKIPGTFINTNRDALKEEVAERKRKTEKHYVQREYSNRMKHDIKGATSPTVAGHASKRSKESHEAGGKKTTVKDKTYDDIAIVRYRSYISDFTRIGGVTWKNLRPQAMNEDYMMKDWFQKLTGEERQVVEALRAA